MSIPIVINNLNRLTTTKKLVEDLARLNYHNVYILDCGSTYKPLLNWYYLNNVKVFHVPNNGQLSIYNRGYTKFFNDKGEDWIVYTDSDIELNSNTPEGFIERLLELGEKYSYQKVGLALKIDDLPPNEFSTIFQEWESKFWKEVIEEDVYNADIDTTFAVIRTDKSFGYKAIRVGGDFTAKHIPWYTDFSNLSEEEKYYLDNANPEYSGYRRYYNLYLSKQ